MPTCCSKLYAECLQATIASKTFHVSGGNRGVLLSLPFICGYIQLKLYEQGIKWPFVRVAFVSWCVSTVHCINVSSYRGMRHRHACAMLERLQGPNQESVWGQLGSLLSLLWPTQPTLPYVHQRSRMDRLVIISVSLQRNCNNKLSNAIHLYRPVIYYIWKKLLVQLQMHCGPMAKTAVYRSGGLVLVYLHSALGNCVMSPCM